MNKRLKMFCMFLLAVSLVMCNLQAVKAAEGSPSKVILNLDKTSAAVGETITAFVKVEGITNFSGIQYHLKYDPSVLQAVNPETREPYPERIDSIDFGNKLLANILLNIDYTPYEIGLFNQTNGTIDAMKTYMSLAKYKESGIAETTGIVSQIGFKVLKAESTSIVLENCPSLSNPIDGTMIADWDGNMVTSGYIVEQSGNINQLTASSTPTNIPSNTPEYTQVPTSTPTPAITSNGRVVLNMSKKSVKAGEVIVGSLSVKNIKELSGIQANLKYDQTLLQPISLKTGNPYPQIIDYTNSDLLFSKRNILSKDEFLPFVYASFDYSNGVINIAKSYSFLQDYKNSNEDEKTGIVVNIGFKALKNGVVNVNFEKTPSMPDTDGLLVFNWDGNRLIMNNPPIVK